MKKTKLSELENLYPELAHIIQNISNVTDEKYFLKKEVFYKLVSYQTEGKKNKRYESHKAFIDIQIIIEGREIISVKDTRKLTVCSSYNVKDDITFYLGDNDGDDIFVETGDALILMPSDGHMPGVSVSKDVSSSVKKFVIKVPYRPQREIRYLVMDVDGTLTDGKIYMSSSGEAIKAFSIKDGCGIHDILLPNHITPMIVTGRESTIVLNRCKELGITEVYQGVDNKAEKLKMLIEDLGTVAYIGDDINDLSCMKAVKETGGVVGCPVDAVEKVKEIADYVAPHNGGDGAARDFIEWIVAQ